MMAAILAAGKGTRMRPFSTHYPKPILPICNKPLLQHQLEMAREIGITEFLVVIGHLGYEIAQALGDGSSLGVRIRYVEQAQTLGIANAFGQLEPFVSSPIMLFLGDIFFVAEDLARMKATFEEREAGAVLAVKRNCSPGAIRRNFTVLVDETEAVRRVIEKPRYAPTGIKGCGLYLFDQEVFDAIRRTPRTAMRDEYEITDTIQIMIDDGGLVLIADVIQWDINMTVPEDVLRCNLFQLDRLGIASVVGEGSTIHPGARLHNSVIGDRVTVAHPITISNSVVFSGSVVQQSHDFDRLIITPEHQFDCRSTFETGNHDV